MPPAGSLWGDGYAYGFVTSLREAPLHVVAMASHWEWVGTHESPDYCDGVLAGMREATRYARVQLVARERERLARVDKRPLG